MYSIDKIISISLLIRHPLSQHCFSLLLHETKQSIKLLKHIEQSGQEGL